MTTATRFIATALIAGGIVVVGAGCAHNSDNQVVPSSALKMSSGNKELAVAAPHDGVVYVRDDADNRIVYSTDVKRGQVVRYDPQSEAVTLDDHLAAGSISGMNHDHSIFFQRSGTVDADQASAAANSSGATTRPSDVPVIHVPLGVRVDVQTQPSESR